jgi:hypothetical protein
VTTIQTKEDSVKTLFVCSEQKINEHVGEYYDDILEVPHQPVSTNISLHSKDVRRRIRDLWNSDEIRKEGEEREVHVYLDAASPFNAMLIDFQIVMGEEEGIVVKLPYLDSTQRKTSDPEALDVLRKLKDREGEK